MTDTDRNELTDAIEILEAQEAQIMAIPMRSRYVRGCRLIISARLAGVRCLMAQLESGTYEADTGLTEDGLAKAILALCDTSEIEPRDVEICLAAAGDDAGDDDDDV